ncbi:MBL fold metallo-hydrolase [Algiphilus sp.]|uniref:MBL fold metallo-hydrolase n=1 Tax=Algiphilus sp. TaxID=1872431 RepID=UPI003B526F33
MPIPTVHAFFDRATFTVSYVVADPETGVCAVVDPVMDYDPSAARTSHQSAEQLTATIREHGYQVEWILETHAHADHLTGAQWIKAHCGGKIAIGENIRQVQQTFAGLFNLGGDFPTDGSQFDHLFADDESFSIGKLKGRVMHTPGHTPACISYVIENTCFVGDTLFMPDYGTARADFPGGDARTLYRSIQRIHRLPADTHLYMCHDYMPGGREPQWETTVSQSRQYNKMIRDGVDEDSFVEVRENRDAGLRAPVLILPSLQVNVRAGVLPEPEDNGIAYLKLPLNKLGGS